MKKICLKCGKQIPLTALECPLCHADARNWSQKHPVWTTVIGIVIGLALVIVFNSKGSKPTTSQPINDAKKLSYTYAFENSRTAESYFVTLDTNTLNGRSVTEGAKEAINEMSRHCFKQCNISVYDDAEAANLDRALLQSPPTSPKEKEDWEKTHYVFVADHFVAYKSFESNDVRLYPYRDAKYDILRGDK